MPTWVGTAQPGGAGPPAEEGRRDANRTSGIHRLTLGGLGGGPSFQLLAEGRAVVDAGQVRHTCQILGPGNGPQEIKTMDDMLFDFLPLVQGQITTAQRQHLHIAVRQEAVTLPIGIHKFALTDRFERRVVSLLGDGGLVGVGHSLEAVCGDIACRPRRESYGPTSSDHVVQSP